MGRLKSAALLAFALLIGVATSGAADTKTLCEGFLPPNDMKIPVGDHSVRGISNRGGITEAQYNAVMDRVQQIYGPVIAAKGKRLVINRLWNDATVNASAEQKGNDWILNMYGGLSRHPDVTIEGEALVVCHELGHHLGGAPKVNSMFGSQWATNEGGADYYATMKCLREFFSTDDNTGIVGKSTIDATARSVCLSHFKTPAEQDLCMRISLSGESVSYLFQSLSKETKRPMYSTPDNSQVTKTNDEHPATQCRMDTYFAGFMCPVSHKVDPSDTDFKVGSCVQGVDPDGYRPRCWFNPDSSSGGGGGGGGSPIPDPGGGDGSCPLGDQSLCDMICQIQPDLPFCHK